MQNRQNRLLEIQGHTKPVTAVALMLRDAPGIVSGSEDATVRMWDINSGQQLLSIDHGGAGHCRGRPSGQPGDRGSRSQ